MQKNIHFLTSFKNIAMCIFARFARVGKKTNPSKTSSISVFFHRYFINYDMINLISVAFVIIAALILYAGIKIAQPDGWITCPVKCIRVLLCQHLVRLILLNVV